MNRTTNTRGYYKRYLSYNLRAHLAEIVLGGLFALGILLGCTILETLDSELMDVFLSVFGAGTTRPTSGFLQMTAMAFLSMLGVLGVLFFCGFGAVFQPMVAFVFLFKGMGFGLVIGFLYATQGQGVLLYYAVILLPRMLLWFLLAVVAARESLHMSLTFLSVLFPALKSRTPTVARYYCVRFVLLGVVALLYALLDTLLVFLPLPL